MQLYVTEQAVLGQAGTSNAIETVLAGTTSEGMRYDDFLNYMADIPAGYVQYGKRIKMCDYIAANYQNTGQTMAEAFPLVVDD
jgi:hypothetical protein